MTSDPDGAIGGYEPHFADVDGLTTRYYHFGDGPPAVLIHGGIWGGAASANSWAGAFDELDERFEVYAFDRLGCGRTEAPADLADVTYDDVVAHARAFIRQRGLDRCHLLGSSFGASIATVLALDEPDPVASLVLTNSASFSPPVGDIEHRRRLLNRGMPEDDDPAGQIRYQFETFSHSTEWVTDAFVEAAVAMDRTEAAQRVTAAMAGDAGARFQDTFRERIQDAHRSIGDGALSTPTLVAWGRNDVTAPLAGGRALFDLIGQRESRTAFHVFNQAGHLPYCEHPAAFARVVDAFVRTHAVGAAP